MNLDKYKNPDYNNKVHEWINVNLKNYLNKKGNTEDQGEIEHILDFLSSDKAPTRIKYMSYEEANNGAKKWVKWLKKKASKIIETEEDTEVVKSFGNGVKLVKLLGKAAFLREGDLMSHCVGSYADRDDTTIYSIRDSNNNPHVTMEVPEGADSLYQCKGKGNGSIHPKYIKYVIKSLPDMGINDIRESEMTHLGYMRMTDELSSMLYKSFDPKSIKTLTYNNKEYFYTNSNVKEITND